MKRTILLVQYISDETVAFQFYSNPENGWWDLGERYELPLNETTELFCAI